MVGNAPVAASSPPATKGLRVSPIPTRASPPTTNPATITRAGPARLLSHGASTLPARPPTAAAVSSRPKPPQPLGHLCTQARPLVDRGRRLALASSWSCAAGGDGGNQGRAGRKGQGVDPEREPGSGREQQATGRRSGQVVAQHVGALQPAVGPLQLLTVAGDQRGDERLGRGVDQGLAGAEHKPVSISSG